MKQLLFQYAENIPIRIRSLRMILTWTTNQIVEIVFICIINQAAVLKLGGNEKAKTFGV